MEKHMHARKLLLSVLAGGPILGTLAGLAVDPTMVPPPEPLWRYQAKAVSVPTQAYYQVDAGPQDLSPYVTPPAYYAIMARRVAAERRYQASLERSSDALTYDVDAAGEVAALSHDTAAGEVAAQAGLEASGDAAHADGAVAAEQPLVPVEPPVVEEGSPAIVL